ncbi:conserved membrane protein of unknown function [Candidatus Filomicrobium marinum]|uniref:TIGR01620 family protein n=1 Tax=Candidatus Filomicrobium marinum TaxID=1608628 RepID=A0A0D6JI18_9HYPH|nr:TIGR01620 family protein [Candidatus Filomicrobium marinum]CFX40204.1 conserved membrane protein of unknown function [Candidatus Filomicrobium marinum]CPR21324.1 conserved membrane protein of unknown function [Candidatus Filomicrobium marinum]
MTGGARGGRKPQAFDPDDPDFIVTEEIPQRQSDAGGAPSDATNTDAGDTSVSSLRTTTRRSLGWGTLLLGSLVSLGLLAATLWVTDFVTATLARDDWVGWLALGLASLAALAATALILRELIGFFRMARLARLRRDAETALRTRDAAMERRVVQSLKTHVARSRDGRWDVRRFREEERHMRAPGALLSLGERVLLARPDAQARRLVYESARRVGAVTALVPIGFIVVGFVLFENLRMVRRLAGAYGGRPGFFGGLRLFGWIIGHMAATGVIALTDDLWGQVLGQDMLRRISRKLGEGAFNGAMTARLGVAAISVCRPVPFTETKPPRARHIFYEAFPELRPAFGAKGTSKNRDSQGED